MRLLFTLLLSSVLSSVLSVATAQIVPPPTGRPLSPRREFGLAAGPATVAAGSPDGRLLLLAGPTPTVAVFQVRTGLLLRTYAGHQRLIVDAVFSPGRDTVVSVDAAGEVCLWNAETLTTMGSWRAPATPVAVKITADGRAALIVLPSGAVWRWNLRQPKTTATAVALTGLPTGARVTVAAMNLNGTHLGLGLTTGSVALCDLANGRVLVESLFKEAITGLVFAGPDSVLALAGTAELGCWRLNPAIPPLEKVVRWPLKQRASALSVEFATGRLAVGSPNGTELLMLPARLVTPLPSASATSRRVWFEPLDDLLLTLGADGRVRSWKLSSPL